MLCHLLILLSLSFTVLPFHILDLILGNKWNLINLPFDEFEHLLNYLNPRDKLNLKLTSKAIEKRLISVDKCMRSWNIEFDFRTDTCLSLFQALMKAKLKHEEDGNLDVIKLSVTFGNPIDDSNRKHLPKEHFMRIVHSVISNWKDNIVNLDLYIHGFEYSAMNPNLRMANLQGLKLRKHEEYNEDNEDNEEKRTLIVSNLIYKYTDNLKSLDMEGFKDVDIPNRMKLTNFTAHNLNWETVQSVLAASTQTLQQFKWRMNFRTSKMEGFVCPSLPHLKELTLIELPLGVLLSILKSCASNLEVLRLYLADFDSSRGKYNILDNISLKDIQLQHLKKFEAHFSDFFLAKEIIKSCKSTLEELVIVDTYKEHGDTDGELLKGFPLLPKMTKFHCTKEDGNIALHIMNLAENITEVALFQMDIMLIEHIDKTRKYTKLKRLKCSNVAMTVVFPIIESAQQSLQEIYLYNIHQEYNPLVVGDRKPIVESYLEKVPFLNLNVKKFSCEYIAKKFSTKFLEAMETTLEELHIRNLDDLTIDEDVQLNLKVLKVAVVKAETAIDILESTQLTLERLCLGYIELKTNKLFQFPNLIFPKLYELEIEGSSQVFQRSFLRLPQLNLKTLICEAMEDHDIINYKKRNPDCIVVFDNIIYKRKTSR